MGLRRWFYIPFFIYSSIVRITRLKDTTYVACSPCKTKKNTTYELATHSMAIYKHISVAAIKSSAQNVNATNLSLS